MLEQRHKEQTQRIIIPVMVMGMVIFYTTHFAWDVRVLVTTVIGIAGGVVNGLVTARIAIWRDHSPGLRVDRADALRWLANFLVLDTLIIIGLRPTATVTALIWTILLLCAQLDLYKQSYRYTVLVIGWITGGLLLFYVPAEPLTVVSLTAVLLFICAIVVLVDLLENNWTRETKNRVDAERLEADLRVRAEIMERDAQLGLQARMISHELKNLITILDISVKQKEAGLESLERSVHFIKRINKIVLEDLKQDPERRQTQVGDVLSDVELLIGKVVARDNIDFKIEIEEEDRETVFEELAGTLFLILRNLVKNACDAVLAKDQEDARGKITIKVSKGPLYLRLSVIDSGVGMDDKTLHALFSGYHPPANARGYGIGFRFVVEQCARQNFLLSGHSETGQGTTIHLDIPLANADLQKSPA